MLKLDIEVQPRDLGEKDNKRNLNQLRGEGWIPAVLYGHGKPAQIAINAKNFNLAISQKGGVNAIFNVKFDGKTDMSIIKEIQRDIITRKPIHVDFQRISVKDKIEVTLPVHLFGESNGVKNQGGILEHMQREIRIKCIPADLPASIDVDINKLDLHQSIKVSDLVPPHGVEFVTPGDHIVVHVVAPRVEEEKPAAGAAEGAAAAQPEVIAKGKKDEEGAAAAGTAAAPAAAAAAKPEKKK